MSSTPKEETESGATSAQDSSEFPVMTSWDDYDIDPNLLRGIYAYGFEKPSSIQQRAILPVMHGRDVIAQAQSGTGKTATFAISALNCVDLSLDHSQVLILSPTRELSAQTASVVTGIGSCMPGLQVQTLFGGVDLPETPALAPSPPQPRNIFLPAASASSIGKITAHVLCGCPGRVFDVLRRGALDGLKIRLVILDEADEMLSPGFQEQIFHIFQRLNPDVQVGLFSATLPESTRELIHKIMRNPVTISVKAEQLTLEGISQYFVSLNSDVQKYETLKDLFSHIALSQTIIYCNSIKRVQNLYEAMQSDGFPVCRIHGDMMKTERENAFASFRNGSCRVLISSNVTSRGIDIQQVSVVINFDVPSCVHNYLHRIGRSGRWGRKGVGINFLTPRDIHLMRNIESHYQTEIKVLPADLSFLSNT